MYVRSTVGYSYLRLRGIQYVQLWFNPSEFLYVTTIVQYSGTVVQDVARRSKKIASNSARCELEMGVGGKPNLQ